MRKQLLIDTLSAPINVNKWTTEIKTTAYAARRYTADQDATIELIASYLKHSKRICSMIDQNIKPFPETYVELVFPSNGPSTTLEEFKSRNFDLAPYGVLTNNSRTFFLKLSDDGVPCYSEIYFDWDMMMLRKIYDENYKSAGTEKDHTKAIKTVFDTVMTLFLMLEHPTAVALDHIPAGSFLRVNKRVAYSARTEIKIKLNDQTTFRKVLNHAASAKKRRHEVSAHWRHYWTVERCGFDDEGNFKLANALGHEWQPIEAPEGDTTERHKCAVCQSTRTRIKNFERGDASIGYVTKEYKVTA